MGTGDLSVIVLVAGLALLALAIPAHAQGDEALPLGGIPYTPWLVPIAFLVGGFAWSVFGWYTSSKNRYDLGHPKFQWSRMLKSGGAGMVLGIIAFSITPPDKMEAVSRALIHGEDGLVGPHEFALACVAAAGIVAAAQVTIKRFRRPAASAGGAS